MSVKRLRVPLLVFSDRTKRNVNRMHMLSGHAVRISSATIGVIHTAVDRLAVMLATSPSSPHAPPSPSGGYQNVGVNPAAPPPPKRRLSLANKVLASTDMILTIAEQSVSTILKSGTSAYRYIRYGFVIHVRDRLSIRGGFLRGLWCCAALSGLSVRTHMWDLLT